MSHQPERAEKNCLNCGATVIGRYCHICGQENVVTKESFWSLAKHFVFDILHFDGKFWHTLKYLIIRPGYVARQYCEGKRNSYLHPIRMYLFTSAVFFLIFFALKGDVLQIKEDALTKEDRAESAETLNEILSKHPGDTSLLRQIALLNDTSRTVYLNQLDSLRQSGFSLSNSKNYSTLSQYDSMQKALPKEKRDGWIARMFTRRGLELKNKYGNNMKQGISLMWTDFLHKLPYMLFLSLPFFALILKLLYIRRKNFFYSDHAIFTLYHYIASFILLVVMMFIGQLENWTHLPGLGLAVGLLFFVWMGYLLVEMKTFYKQGWAKTTIKFLLADLLGFFVILLLFIAFLLVSIFMLK